MEGTTGGGCCSDIPWREEGKDPVEYIGGEEGEREALWTLDMKDAGVTGGVTHSQLLRHLKTPDGDDPSLMRSYRHGDGATDGCAGRVEGAGCVEGAGDAPTALSGGSAAVHSFMHCV